MSKIVVLLYSSCAIVLQWLYACCKRIVY